MGLLMDQQVQEVVRMIKDIVGKEGEITGSRLSDALRSQNPEWRPSDAGFRNLREFISHHVKDVTVARRAGMDLVYQTGSHQGTASIAIRRDYAVEARKLIKELAVNDVLLIVARKSERAPNLAELASLRPYPKALAAACEINRHYRINAARVYFGKIELQKSDKRVLIFYVGPHPEEPMEAEVLFSLLS